MIHSGLLTALASAWPRMIELPLQAQLVWVLGVELDAKCQLVEAKTDLDQITTFPGVLKSGD